MSLISEKTIDDFGTWAKENADKSVFPKIYETEKSYYTNRNPKEAYLMEYSFGNMVELKKALEVYSGLSADVQMLKSMTVEICRSNPKALEVYENLLNEKEEKIKESSKTLPEFVYVF